MATIPRQKTSALREIPSVDEILRTDVGRKLQDSFGTERATGVVRSFIETIRKDGLEGDPTRESITKDIERRMLDELSRGQRNQQQPVVNATGVIIHTNLGRAPLSANAVEAAVNAAGYCNLEFDLESGERGKRGEAAERILSEVAGSEDALIVNNCAAAAFLVLSVFGRGGEVIVSRGELVEIGGDFRIPDVLERSGARLREVGTTNRTKLSDYERAIGENTKLILRVHPSNYRITGFTETPPIRELATLAHQHNLPIFEDAGSGALIDLSGVGLDEPVIGDSIESGVDIVSFSGDKLMGGSQAGLIVGRREMVTKLRKDPLYRALRPDKFTYAITEATLRMYLEGTAIDNVPVLNYLSMTAEDIADRAAAFVGRLEKNVPVEISLTVVPGNSAVGGGAAPNVELPTSLIAIEHEKFSADAIAKKLRTLETPIIGRVASDRFLIDLRTVNIVDEKLIEEAITNLI